jgi:hypothetical protein
LSLSIGHRWRLQYWSGRLANTWIVRETVAHWKKEIKCLFLIFEIHTINQNHGKPFAQTPAQNVHLWFWIGVC